MDRSTKTPSERLPERKPEGAARVDPLYWEQMARMSPEEVCPGTGARVAGDGVYAVEFLGRELFCLFAANAELFMPVDGLADVAEYTAKKVIEIVST